MKRLFDLIAAVIGLCFLTPALLLLMLTVCLKHGFPVIFRQSRPGLYCKPFTMYKFRTMTDKRGADGNLLPDEQRLKGFDKFMRSTSLDELPELINVLKGR